MPSPINPTKVTPSLVTILKQMINFPQNYLKGHMQTTKQTLIDLKPGEGAIVEINGKKVAAYKSSETETITISPLCTHLG